MLGSNRGAPKWKFQSNHIQIHIMQNYENLFNYVDFSVARYFGKSYSQGMFHFTFNGKECYRKYHADKNIVLNWIIETEISANPFNWKKRLGGRNYFQCEA